MKFDICKTELNFAHTYMIKKNYRVVIASTMKNNPSLSPDCWLYLYLSHSLSLYTLLIFYWARLICTPAHGERERAMSHST